MIPKDTPVGTKVRVLRAWVEFKEGEIVEIKFKDDSNLPFKCCNSTDCSWMYEKDLELITSDSISSPFSHFLNHDKLFSQS